MCRSGASPFRPSELVDRLKQMTRSLQSRRSGDFEPQE